MSATPDSTLANPEQRIADLERQLAEALEREMATAEVLQVINSSPGNLKPVFDAMLGRALHLCGAAFGFLAGFDGQRFHALASRGLERDARGFVEDARLWTPDPGSAMQQMIDGTAIFHIPDVVDTDAYRSGVASRLRLVEVTGARSALWVALRNDRALIGALVLYWREVHPFTETEAALLSNFAAQAVIAMENARLITETREALEQQTATAEVLQVINASPGDLAPVFNAMLEKALHLCEAAFGNLCGFDGATFPVLAAHGLTTHQTLKPDPGSALERMMRADDVVHIPDVVDTEAYRAGMPGRVGLVQNTGARTALWVALRKDQALRGVFVIYRREVRPFTDKQIALLQNFAAQAVIAMENARLITETREALEQQTATAEVLQVINSSPGELAPVFDAMLEKAMTLCEAAFGFVRSYDGEKFDLAASRGVPVSLNDFLVEARVPTDINPLGRVVRGETIIHVADIREEAAYQAGFPGMLALADFGGCRTALWVALRKGNALLGVFIIYRQEIRPFSEKQIALVQNFAAQAVIAIENARLLGELRQRTEEVAELNRGLEARVAEQVEELGRVGRLKRFLAPQLAELIVSQGDEKILESHRREIVVLFCDLRGYTAFTETAEPEEVLDFLREYHGALGPLVSQFEGTLDQFSGDGIMVFFNDPVPCPDPAERAVKMAMAMREAAGTLIADWRERGRDLGFGAGIAQGYATLGQIGFSERSGYTAIGTVCNVAARLCAEAKDGQILLSQLVNVALKGSLATEQLGPLALKGLTQPVVAYNVPLVGSQAAFRVIEGGAPSA
jgi:adenylate cyclase